MLHRPGGACGHPGRGGVGHGRLHADGRGGVQPTAGHLFPPKVTFDRPYLMLVTDRATGEPLFMARVADPSRT